MSLSESPDLTGPVTQTCPHVSPLGVRIGVDLVLGLRDPCREDSTQDRSRTSTPSHSLAEGTSGRKRVDSTKGGDELGPQGPRRYPWDQRIPNTMGQQDRLGESTASGFKQTPPGNPLSRKSVCDFEQLI